MESSELAEARAQIVGLQAEVLGLQQALLELQQRQELRAASDQAGAVSARERVQQLERELAQQEERRVEREREWLRFTKLLDDRWPVAEGGQVFQPQVPAEQIEPVESSEQTLGNASAPETEQSEQAPSRVSQLHSALRSLLWIEGLRGLELLECGQLQADCLGPVVFRTFDASGNSSGLLQAKRLRLEASRSARSLTIVLEDGFESSGGRRVDFLPKGADPTGAGERRIVLQGLDPMPWVETMPELFGSAPLERVVDDGRWNKEVIRAALNQLLLQDGHAGWLRLESLEGIALGVLRGVHVESYAAGGGLERRIFADRLRIVRMDPRSKRGILLCFEDGAIERAGEQRPFLDGRWQVYLPRADAKLFAAAGIPLEDMPSDRVLPPQPKQP